MNDMGNALRALLLLLLLAELQRDRMIINTSIHSLPLPSFRSRPSSRARSKHPR